MFQMYKFILYNERSFCSEQMFTSALREMVNGRVKTSSKNGTIHRRMSEERGAYGEGITKWEKSLVTARREVKTV